jgi:hypothetical protein
MRTPHLQMLVLGGLAALAVSTALVAHAALTSATNKDSVKVEGGLKFAEFKGYEDWQVVSVSMHGQVIAAVLGNPQMIRAYKAGIPGNGQPVPDGARMAKIHWVATASKTAPTPTTVSGELHDVGFMVKDSKRFADSAGWGWAAFQYDPAAHTFRPSSLDDHPPQEHNAKCGLACHTIVKNRDYVFSAYGNR